MALNLSKNKINKLISLLNSSDESSDDLDDTDNCNEIIKVVNLEYKPIELEDSSGSDSDNDDEKSIKFKSEDEDTASSDDRNSITEFDPNDPLNINSDDKNLNLNLFYPKQEMRQTDDGSNIITQNTIKSKSGKRKYIKNSMLILDYRDDNAIHEPTKSSAARGKYRCHLCKSRCFTQTQLNSHLKIHESSDAGKFYCRTCDIVFATSPNLRRHIKSHQLKPKRFFQIEPFGTELQFETSCMPNETKILECKICNITFTKILILRRHLEDHKKPENFDIEIIKNNNYLTNLIPNGATNLTKLIDYVVAELEAGRIEKFYSATNMVGNELNLSDSETDSDIEEELIPNNLYFCELCDKKFSRRYKILNHQKNDHTTDEMKIECDLCKMKYVSKNLLEYHLKTQCGNAEKPYSCYICKIKYMWKDNMRRHIKLHHKTKLEECHVCKKMVTRLDSHLVVHDLEKNFQCEKCLMKFKRKSNLRVHMKIHDENYNDPSHIHKSYLCGFCGRKFRSSSNLAVHTRRHTGEKPYKCEFCDRGYPSSSDLKTHRKTHTVEKPVKVKEPPSMKKSHICGFCGKKFQKSSNLSVHIRRHTGEKPYKCEFCDKGYPSSSDLTRHRRTHTGEKPVKVNDSSKVKKSYLCGFCGRSFGSSSNLAVHKRRHTGEKPYKCELYNKNYPSTSYINTPLKTQTEEKTMKINDSTETKKSYMYGFADENLTLDTCLHTSGIPIKCEFCDMVFLTSTDLNKHRMTHTEDKPKVN